ncbi:phage tail protein [Staphylococcus delphini]|uniref:phage tail protein n=1 Tax=Staphylococcus delphini TaxID=53344 RepID=UPI0021D30645|nr:terminase [Staphylococcus delphini]UXS43737.1 terminase [Staphylococcus delphini]UXV46338.1 terminase [Staphylococcus delphini]
MEKNFHARINAIIKNFERGVRKVQRLAKTSVPNEIETEIKANTSKFQRALTKAKAMAQKWRKHTVNLGMETKEYKANLEKAKAQVAKFKQHKVDLKLSNKELMAKYKATKETVEAWRKHVVKLDLDASPAEMALKGFKEDLIDLTKHKFDIDTGRWKLGGKFTKEFNEIEGQARTSFGRIKKVMAKTWHDGGEALSDFSDKMDHLATRIRTFGTVFSHHIKGVLVASFQALIPVIAGLVPVVMAVGNALKVVTGGALALAGALAIGAGGVVAFGAMGISAIKMLNDGTLKATSATKKYEKALDGVKDTWTDIIKQNQSQIFTTMANGLNTVKVALQGLNPFFSGVSSQMEKASASVLKWAKTSNVAKKFFEEMGTTGVSIFGDLLRSAGQFGAGMVSMFTQLMPLFKWSSQWLQRLGEDFNKWVNSAKGQNAIKEFMNYTKTNLPIIGNIFKNTFAGVNNLLKAFAGNSTNIFKALEDMTAKFRDWSETVGKSEGFKKFVKYVEENGPVIMKLIGDIVRILVAFGKAMAPIASGLLKLIGKIVEFTAALFENHPNIARFFGILTILGGAFWALLTPIIFVSTILKNVFGKSLFDVLKHVVKFAKVSTLLSGAFNLIKGAIGLLLNPIGNLMKILPVLGGALASISLPIWIVIGAIIALAGFIIYLWNTNEDFRKVVIKAWDEIRQKVGEAIDGVKKWLSDLWSKIQETLQPIMPLLQQLGTIANQVLGVVFISLINGLMVALQGLWTLIQIVFTAIGTIISVVIQLIVGIFTAFIQFLSGDFSGAWETLKNTIANVGETIWQGIQSIWNTISQFLLDTYNRITGQTASSWSEVWQTIQNYAIAIWNVVVQWFQKVVNSIWEKMVAAYNYVVQKGEDWVNAIRQAMTNFKDAVVQKFWEVVDSCKKGMQDALDAIRNFFDQFSEVGRYLMEGLANGIKRGVRWVIDAAKGVAQDAVNAAKTALGINSPSRVFKEIGQFVSQGLGMGIEKDAYKAVNAVQGIASKLTNAFDARLSPDFDIGGLTDSLTGDINGFIVDDVRHSIEESNRPIVNLHVQNDGDAEFIRTYIKDMDSKEYYT